MSILETPSMAPRCGFVPSLIKKGQGGALLEDLVVGCLANFSSPQINVLLHGACPTLGIRPLSAIDQLPHGKTCAAQSLLS